MGRISQTSRTPRDAIIGCGMAALFFMTTTVLTACGTVGPPALERAVLGYDKKDSEIRSQLLLLNIARWHEEDNPHFTVTSSIAATFDWSTTARIDGRTNEPRGIDSLGFSLGGTARENPTFSIQPLQGSRYVNRLLKPLTESIFNLIVFDETVEFDRVLRLMAQGIEVYHPKRGLEIERFIANTPRFPEQYREFRRLALHFRWLYRNRRLFVRRLIFEDTLFRDVKQLPRPGDLVKGLDAGLTWRQKPDGRYKVSKITQGRVVITNYDPGGLSDRERWLLNGRIKTLPVNLVYLDIKPGPGRGDLALRGAIKLRSLLGILGFIAEGMDEYPEFDVEKDPMTGDLMNTENPASALKVVITRTSPSANVPSVEYRGRYYSVANTKWDLRSFRLLAALNQTAVGDVAPIGLPITISK